MKNSKKRRLLSLVLALVMVLTLAPAAGMSEGSSGGDQTPDSGQDGSDQDQGSGNDNTGSDEKPDDVTGIRLGVDGNSSMLRPVTPNQEYYLILEPGAVNSGTIRLTVDLEPSTAANDKRKVTWKSSNEDIVSALGQTDMQHPGEGHIGVISSHNLAGKSEVTISVDEKLFCTIHVEVSGIKLSDELLKGVTLKENETRRFVKDTDYQLYGIFNSSIPGNGSVEATMSVTAQTGQRNVNIPASTSPAGFSVEGRTKGSARLLVQVTAGPQTYGQEFTVNVEATEVTIPYTAGCSPTKPLKFTEIEPLIDAECRKQMGVGLDSVVDLRVPSAQGILYVGYKSPDDTGPGAGSAVTYYAQGKSTRGPFLSDITFVPSASYRGEKAQITFTAQATGSDGQARTFKGTIEVTLTDEKTDLTVTTRRETPLKLTAELFTRACQEAVGSPLDYVIFTLPPATQGALYVDYKSESDYASKVSANRQYARKELDNITFVPAKGFVGNVSVSYAGYSVAGSKYTGELVIQVQQGLDDSITYNDNATGSVTFSGSDFNEFCANATGSDLGSVSFTLPPASQGVLYASWSGSRGVQAAEGQTFSAAGLNRVTFVAAQGFDGVVRIPFEGVSRGGTAFKGTVEIHIQSSGTSGSGDISYACAAGQSVKLQLSDFIQLCQRLTGQRLHYITFQRLPDFNQGALYHGKTSSGGMGTRVSTSTKYFNSATPYIANLSFWATQNFSGGVEIPFTGCSVDGQTFTAILYIGNGAGPGSGSSGTITYNGAGQETIRFVGKDFDDACRQATNEALQYVSISLPSSGQGILYYDYFSEVNPTVLDANNELYLNGDTRIDRVTFAPARGFAGTLYLSYMGVSINGRAFSGTIAITYLAANAMGGLVRYETTGAPVRLDAVKFQEASGGSPSQIRFTSLPTPDQGKLYYNYTSPTQYSWLGNTSSTYGLYTDPAVGNLTFVPKAGFYGEVNIPYTAMNQEISPYTGTLRITVTQPQASANFDDLAGYPAQTKSAVDYLHAESVVNGVGQRRYSPDASIRRGDFCLMLARAFQFNVGSTATGFTDVASDAYYAQAVNQLYALGVVNGVGGGRFSPSAPVSRQDAALMVQRTLQQAGIDVPNGNEAALAAYDDRGEVSSYAQGAVGGLAQQGLLPLSDGKLAPRTDLTRADMAVLLHRAMTQ